MRPLSPSPLIILRPLPSKGRKHYINGTADGAAQILEKIIPLTA